MFKTRISLKNATPETIKKTLEWCTMCQTRDKTFHYTRQGNFIIITSPTKDTAYKRGMAIYKRFKLNFNVEKQKGEEQ